MTSRIIENYKDRGHAIIIIEDNYGKNMGFGIGKARLIQYHFKDIEDFIEKYSKQSEE